MKLKSSFIKKIYPIIILQCVSVLILVISVLLIKFFSSDMFTKIEKIHSEYFEDETKVDSIIENKAAVASVPVYLPKETSFDNSLVIPLSGKISSNYGNRSDPFTAKQKLHKGIDIAAKKGSDIVAVADGEVSFVGFDKNGFGNYLTVAHNDNIKSLYGHCDKILVKMGEKITKGQIIAKVGNTGITTGDHLHFEIRIDGNPINPNYFLDFE